MNQSVKTPQLQSSNGELKARVENKPNGKLLVQPVSLVLARIQEDANRDSTAYIEQVVVEKGGE